MHPDVQRQGKERNVFHAYHCVRWKMEYGLYRKQVHRNPYNASCTQLHCILRYGSGLLPENLSRPIHPFLRLHNNLHHSSPTYVPSAGRGLSRLPGRTSRGCSLLSFHKRRFWHLFSLARGWRWLPCWCLAETSFRPMCKSFHESDLPHRCREYRSPSSISPVSVWWLPPTSPFSVLPLKEHSTVNLLYIYR